MKTPPPTQSLPLLNPHAAGIDVGSLKMYAAVVGGSPRVFGCCTADLRELKDWLLSQQVTTVAMEATGVYWLCLYAELEAAGLEVVVVNAAHAKQVPGRKSDIADCQWLATLHAHGLLRNSFVPPDDVRQVRDVMRVRDDLIRMASQHILHMHKALERLGLKIHTVLSDMTGFSGLQLIRAILDGERRPEALVELCDNQVTQAKRQPLLKALEGNWRPEHLFALRVAVESWDFYQKQIAQCDGQLKALLDQQVEGKTPPSLGPKKELRHNAPKTMPDLQSWMARLFGVDLTRLPILNEYTLMKLYAEVGSDLSRWPEEKKFTAWLGLAPAHRQSGNRIRRQWRPMGTAGRIFCLAAQSVANAKKTWLASVYRRIRSLRGARVALKAVARILATLFYRAATKGWVYAEQGINEYQAKFQIQQHRRLRNLARALGMAVVPITQPS
jgi:transposase